MLTQPKPTRSLRRETQQKTRPFLVPPGRPLRSRSDQLGSWKVQCRAPSTPSPRQTVICMHAFFPGGSCCCFSLSGRLLQRANKRKRSVLGFLFSRAGSSRFRSCACMHVMCREVFNHARTTAPSFSPSSAGGQYPSKSAAMIFLDGGKPSAGCGRRARERTDTR
jgi:hypothetical protein